MKIYRYTMIYYTQLYYTIYQAISMQQVFGLALFVCGIISMAQELQRLREDYANEQQKREEKQIPQLAVIVNWSSCWFWDVLSHCNSLNLNGKSWNVSELQLQLCQDAEVREKMQRAKLEQLEIQRLGLCGESTEDLPRVGCGSWWFMMVHDASCILQMCLDGSWRVAWWYAMTNTCIERHWQRHHLVE